MNQQLLTQLMILENECKTTNPDYQQIVTKCDKLIPKHPGNLQLFLLWINVSCKIKNLDLLPSIIKQLKQLCKNNLTEEEREQLDIALSTSLSSLNLLPSGHFSLRDYQLAKHIEGKAQQTADPANFIAEELEHNKTRAFFHEHKQAHPGITNFLSACSKLPVDLPQSKKTLQTLLEIMPKENAPIAIKHAEAESPDEAPTFRNRKEAYQQLRKIAKYLTEHEPHAFTGYLLTKLASMENSTLACALKEFPQLENIMKSLQ